MDLKTAYILGRNAKMIDERDLAVPNELHFSALRLLFLQLGSSGNGYNSVELAFSTGFTSQLELWKIEAEKSAPYFETLEDQARAKGCKVSKDKNGATHIIMSGQTLDL